MEDMDEEEYDRLPAEERERIDGLRLQVVRERKKRSCPYLLLLSMASFTRGMHNYTPGSMQPLCCYIPMQVNMALHRGTVMYTPCE